MGTNALSTISYRKAKLSDINALLALESECFSTDKISKRSFRRWIKSEKGILLVAEVVAGTSLMESTAYSNTSEHLANSSLLGYGLVYCHKGRRLVRLYSMAVSEKARNKGIAQEILQLLEDAAVEQGRLFMRLEVNANNSQAIRLYERCGYKIFGGYTNYYEDQSDALRMQKKIFSAKTEKITRVTPWYYQTTDFTCGPSALMMAMESLTPNDKANQANQLLELAIWREATTIFMTSGHGGCHPIGLGLAACRRGFATKVFINTEEELFTDGVRSEAKKQIVTTVDKQFKVEANQLGVELIYQDIEQNQIAELLAQGYAVIVLISTYRLDGKKSPHWVTVTHIDETCLYVHDPDLDEHDHNPIDCQHVPIARTDFEKMSTFGTSKLRTAVAIKPIP